jgi:hypothetical protein
MSPEYYRHRAMDCCRNAVKAENMDRRSHWLEAAARWISLARQEGVLPRQTNVLLSPNSNRGMRCRKISASAKAEPTATSRVNAKTP